jgi:hypothetical protein
MENIRLVWLMAKVQPNSNQEWINIDKICNSRLFVKDQNRTYWHAVLGPAGILGDNFQWDIMTNFIQISVQMLIMLHMTYFGSMLVYLNQTFSAYLSYFVLDLPYQENCILVSSLIKCLSTNWIILEFKSTNFLIQRLITLQ